MDIPNTTRQEGIQCDICSKTFRAQGFPNHRRACEGKKIEAIQLQDHIARAETARVKKSKPQSHNLLGINTDFVLLPLIATTKQTGTFGGPTVVKPWENVGRLCK